MARRKSTTPPMDRRRRHPRLCIRIRLQVAASKTINAIAIDPALQNSNVSTAAYVIQAGGSSINFGSGFSSTTGLTLNGSAVATDDSRLQLTNGGTDQAGSVFWNEPIGIQAFTTNFGFQLSNAKGHGFTFTIQNEGSDGAGEEHGRSRLCRDRKECRHQVRLLQRCR